MRGRPGFGSLRGFRISSFGVGAMEGATLAGATLDCASLDSSVSNAATADAEASCRRAFRTPPRILIPKLVAGRDGWKRKADDRKRRLKSAKIRIRDLDASRARWRARAEDAEAKIDALRRELAQAREALAAAEAERLRDESKKRSMPGR